MNMATPNTLYYGRFCSSIALAWALSLGPTACPADEEHEFASEQIVSLQFSGGSVAEYVAELRTEAPAFNVVVTNDAANLPLPAIELQNVSALAAFNCIELAGTGELVVEGEMDEEIFFVRRNVSTRPRVAVSNVQRLLQDRGEEDLLSAIEIGLRMFQGTEVRPDVELKLHRETGLLFSKGTDEEIELIEEIVRAMDGDPQYVQQTPSEESR